MPDPENGKTVGFVIIVPFHRTFKTVLHFFVFYHTGICIYSPSVIMICYSSADFCSISGAEQARVYPGGCY